MRSDGAHRDVTERIIGGAMKVHTALGPGLLESAYQACLAHELSEGRLSVAREVALPVTYRGLQLDVGYRLDLLINGVVIVELKSVDSIAPIHRAQLMSYLKLSGNQVGLLINFNVERLKDGITRIVIG